MDSVVSWWLRPGSDLWYFAERWFEGVSGVKGLINAIQTSIDRGPRAPHLRFFDIFDMRLYPSELLLDTQRGELGATPCMIISSPPTFAAVSSRQQRGCSNQAT